MRSITVFYIEKLLFELFLEFNILSVIDADVASIQI